MSEDHYYHNPTFASMAQPTEENYHSTKSQQNQSSKSQSQPSINCASMALCADAEVVAERDTYLSIDGKIELYCRLAKGDRKSSEFRRIFMTKGAK
ncbi:hypothetical protein PROFUN_09616 [Planoprotostelium fungivorum]|uniref:Uncharacterized protein n=1 Tax=Planoprotostelium fungivorum TaxID=1890364 RepID=A0A2P6MNZ8_9EUKA|nr:hypothetical protein PROFUN_09616 [Planoprotostelium fungivorum]